MLTLSNAAGKRMFMAGTRPQGGLLNLMNAGGVPVFIAGYAESNRGGAMSIKNGRGIPVVSAGSTDSESGIVTVWDADGRKPRTLVPGL